MVWVSGVLIARSSDLLQHLCSVFHLSPMLLPQNRRSGNAYSKSCVSFNSQFFASPCMACNEGCGTGLLVLNSFRPCTVRGFPVRLYARNSLRVAACTQHPPTLNKRVASGLGCLQLLLHCNRTNCSSAVRHVCIFDCNTLSTAFVQHTCQPILRILSTILVRIHTTCLTRSVRTLLEAAGKACPVAHFSSDQHYNRPLVRYERAKQSPGKRMRHIRAVFFSCTLVTLTLAPECMQRAVRMSFYDGVTGLVSAFLYSSMVV